MTEDQRPYNPLDRKNLGRSVEYALLIREPRPLNGLPAFRGAGIYAIYYCGDFPMYEPISGTDWRVPIYVGKADVPGARKGVVDSNYQGTALWGRLDDHAKSIRHAVNLEIADFYVRYLVVDDIWIPLGESLMIGNYRPLWNGVIDGFGLHDPGAGRHGSLRSEWDELHPGRPWYVKMAPRPDPGAIEHKVLRHYGRYPPPPVAEVPEDG